MVQQGLVLIWLVGSALTASLMAILTCRLDSKSLSLVKSRFEFSMTANLPFEFGSQVGWVLRQLAEPRLQWGGPSLF
ncbi:hypothetical protein BA953_02575 [Vibrio coralliilyticus]|nr:hypothetical protein BA953_02575 [Vibrio coralliilyticus]